MKCLLKSCVYNESQNCKLLNISIRETGLCSKFKIPRPPANYMMYIINDYKSRQLIESLMNDKNEPPQEK